MTSSGHASVRVMLADDSDAVRDALSQIIDAETSLELVAVAKDAQEAIDLAVRHLPDVALIDVRMPAGGGVRATREICRNSSQTTVVALSAADDRTSVLQMLESGALGYLVKGSDIGELIETIKRSARHQPSLSLEAASHIVDELGRKLRSEEAEAAQLREVSDRIERTLEGGTLAVALQPIVAIPSGQLAGYEALARFDAEPVQAPHRWFADAERVGLRLELEFAAIETALAELPY